MAEEPTRTSSIGRPRQIIGNCSVVLGAIITGRSLWLGMAWDELELVQRIRFFGLLWIGIVLMLAGSWLAFRSRFAGWSFIIVFISPPFIFYGGRALSLF